MTQAADVRPDPTLQRKAAIAYGGPRDHRGKVDVRPIPNFDLDRTIFQTLEGTAARFVMATRVGKEPHWASTEASAVQDDYDAAVSGLELPDIDPALLTFMVEECDFDVEHADGSFLDHLYFGFEYCAKHYANGSPLVMLLHSILGTGTNTFAMDASKIPSLESLLPAEDWVHVASFPSVLRLLYEGRLIDELAANVGREIDGVSMHRVIDDAPLELSGDEFWDALNYQLVHLIDFIPVANWSVHASDTSFILFRDLYELLQRSGHLDAHVEYTPTRGEASPEGESMSLVARLTTKIPVGVARRMAAKSVRRFSEQCGHSLEYSIRWG
jgi:hypothetical protein